jgi:hypothetical protein
MIALSSPCLKVGHLVEKPQMPKVIEANKINQEKREGKREKFGRGVNQKYLCLEVDARYFGGLFSFFTLKTQNILRANDTVSKI